ncbi:hypothetical protein OG728_38900 (plasmid) [Streptomyces microflavus]|uniref:hypothetical protein n=1 Tax=Streptomyces microflavus TaxID=1919 RepID=UPI002E0D8404|nr:hypothetical protein OG728_38900 [Streptomyces microflavus]
MAPAPCVNGERERRSESAVDDGEIRWTDKTRYDGPRENALKVWQFSGARIKLRADSATTVNDLEFRDYRGGTGDRAAVAQYVRDSGTLHLLRGRGHREAECPASAGWRGAAVESYVEPTGQSRIGAPCCGQPGPGRVPCGRLPRVR